LDVAKKDCPPAEDQLPLESRKVWKDVTTAIHAKEFSKATKMKQSIETRQRKDAAARKEMDQEWVPTYFVLEDNSGRPELSVEGREMVESIIRGGNYSD
jgi:hypothetical protein